VDKRGNWTIERDDGRWYHLPYSVWDPEGDIVGVTATLRGAKRMYRRAARRWEKTLAERARDKTVYSVPEPERFGEHLLKSKRVPGEVNFPGPGREG